MRDAFAMQKLLSLFQQKYWNVSDINVWSFNETLTNKVVSFEQPGPEVQVCIIDLYKESHKSCTKHSTCQPDITEILSKAP